MEKKKFNWIGCLLTTVFVLIAIILIHICIRTDETNPNIQLMAMSGICVIIVLIPITWGLGWRMILLRKKV